VAVFFLVVANLRHLTVRFVRSLPSLIVDVFVAAFAIQPCFLRVVRTATLNSTIRPRGTLTATSTRRVAIQTRSFSRNSNVNVNRSAIVCLRLIPMIERLLMIYFANFALSIRFCTASFEGVPATTTTDLDYRIESDGSDERQSDDVKSETSTSVPKQFIEGHVRLSVAFEQLLAARANELLPDALLRDAVADLSIAADLATFASTHCDALQRVLASLGAIVDAAPSCVWSHAAFGGANARGPPQLAYDALSSLHALSSAKCFI
jgi:hypothetical protein